MPYAIFCPSNHLILDLPTCPECGWIRPTLAEAGALVWQVDLKAELGGPGRSVFAKPAASQGVVVFPMANGELAGLGVADGRLRWRTALDPGMLAWSLVPDGRRMLASLSDIRPLEQAGNACLAAIDPLDGEINMQWESEGHQLGNPILTDDLVVVRTSRLGLVALGRTPELRIAWKRELQGWWAQPTCLFADRLVFFDGNPMRGEGSLHAIRLADGAGAWERPMEQALFGAPAGSDGRLFIRCGRTSLLALDLESGETLWTQIYRRIYGSLLASPEGLFVVVRGETGPGEAGHYQLERREPGNGRLVWAAPLPANARVRVGPMLAEGMLLMTTDDGGLLTCDPQTGKLGWTLKLSTPDDPPRTEQVIDQGLLFVGTAAGKVSAVQITAPIEGPCEPEVYLEQGSFESAAATFALCGNLNAAAEIYAGKLDQPDKALALYEKSGALQEAGELALQRELLSQARGYFEKAGLPLRAAEALVQMGDYRSAARLYEDSGELCLAASQFENTCEYRKALELFTQAGDLESAERLRPLVPVTPDDVERLERTGKLVEAGEAALKIADWGKAADLFHRAEDRLRELIALDQLASAQGETWALERLAALARSLGRFVQEAESWLRLERFAQAGEAFLHAAQQLENREPQKESEIAALFDRAYRLYDDQGLEEEAAHCREQVLRYRHLPWLIVAYGQIGKALREGEQNYLDLTVRNVGFGVAHMFSILLDNTRFELDREATLSQVKRLAPGMEKQVRVFLKPLEGQVGEGVPLALTWSWMDLQNREYSERMSWPVIVRRENEPAGPATPVEIHYHGTVYQAQEGIEVVSGDKVGHDKVAGDQFGEAGQKGDRVEIGRPERRSANREMMIICPNCSVGNRTKDKFCQACGEALKK